MAPDLGEAVALWAARCVVSAVCLLFVVSGAILVRRCLRLLCWLRSGTPSGWAPWRRGAPKSRDDFEARVEAVLKKDCVQRVQKAARTLTPFLGPAFLLINFHSVVDVLFRTQDREVGAGVLYRSSFGGHLFVVALTILCGICPRCIQTRARINFMMTLCLFRMVVTLCFAVDMCDFHQKQAHEVILRALFCGTCGSMTLALMVNAVGFVAGVIVRRWLENVFLFEGMVIAAAYACMVITATHYIHASLRSEIRATLEAKASRNVERAAEVLLSGVCDAVVHLNSGLQVSAPAPKLAALLLRGGLGDRIGESMVGVSLLELLQEDDRENAKEFFDREDDLAGSLHVHMRDSTRTPVSVQLFSARGIDADDKIFHVVGVKESGDDTLTRYLRPPPSGHGSTRSLTSSFRSSSRASLPLSDVADYLALWLDLRSKDLELVESSPSFLALSTMVISDGLLPRVVNKWEFLNWLERTVKSSASGHGRSQRHGYLHLRGLTEGQVCKSTTANVCLSMCSPEEFMWDEVKVPRYVRLTLENAQQQARMIPHRRAVQDPVPETPPDLPLSL